MMEEPTLYLDVRSPEEFRLDALPDSKNVPLDYLARDMSQLGPRDRPIVVYCRSGRRSAVAAGLLRRAGFTDVLDAGAIDVVRRP